MWPWEHLAFGYVLYSGYTRGRYGNPPEDRPVIALVVATQFPDLVDKPLAWTLALLPTARSLGHSVFFAAAVVLIVVAITRWRDIPKVSTAIAIGYGSHLLGDILYAIVRGGSVNIGYLLWPLITQPVRDTPGTLSRTVQLLTEFTSYLGSPTGLTYLAVELGLLLLVIVLWTADGSPGPRLRN